MGLDYVELIMATEEAFGIKFSSDDVYSLDTPGKVVDYIYERVSQDKNGKCASQQAFYLLRKAIQSVFHLDRKIIKLETPIRSFITNIKDGKSWFELQSALGARTWPKLRRPAWLRHTLVVTVLALPILFFMYLYPIIGSEGASILSIITMIIIGIILYKLTKSLRNTIPNHGGCVKNLIQYAQTSSDITWTRHDISCLFRQVVIEQIGIKESQYREDARFIEDLGMES